jgi:hypothetical protein
VHAAQRVPQFVDLAVAFRAVVGPVDVASLQLAASLLDVAGVCAVDPGEHHVDVEVDIVGVVVEHPGQSGPALSVALDIRQHCIETRDAAPGERIGSGSDDLQLAERPEFEPHRRLDRPPSHAGLTKPASVEQEQVGVLAGQPSEREQPLRPFAGPIDARVERLVGELLRESGFDLRPGGAVDCDDRPVVVAAHKQVGDQESIEGGTHAEQVPRHRVDAGHAGSGERESATVSNHIAAGGEPALAGQLRQARHVAPPLDSGATDRA